MTKRARTFWLTREGHNATEYEDALAADEAAGRFAVADGATEGCFTGLWAKLLVEGFVSNSVQEAGDWPDSLPNLQSQWDADVRARNLPWYGEEGVRQGAFATFLGLAFDSRSEHSYKWQAVAVGDTCVLHTRENKLIQAFPLTGAEQFDNFPKLVGSRMTAEDVRTRQNLWTNGRGQSGDRLWMMTDALAQWCLTEIEAGRNPWRSLESLLTLPAIDEQFASLIQGLRNAGELRNDDVTLLAIEL